MKIIFGADHRGFELKQFLVEEVKQWGYEVVDVGAEQLNQLDDYVDYGKDAIESMSDGDKAVLLCGSGHGMDITANRYRQVRAILGFNMEVVAQGRLHENANVLVIPGDWVSREDALRMVKVFMETAFSGEERHMLRLKKLAEL